MEHIGLALRRPADEAGHALGLAALARVACWSPEHLDRVYRLHVGEPPMATVRRLRLGLASRALLAGQPLRLVAEQAGYASTQAFGRAFERRYGATPSRWVQAEKQAQRARQGNGEAPAGTALSIVTVQQAQACHRLRYEGDASGVSAFFDDVVDRLQRSGSPRGQWQVFGRGDDAAAILRRPGARLVLDAVVLAAPLAQAPAGFGHGTVEAGAYAKVPLDIGAPGSYGWCAGGLDDRLHDAGWQCTGQPLLRHYDTDPAYTAPPERREWLYVPLARRC
jgi:AraC-like DNA-binding protein